MAPRKRARTPSSSSSTADAEAATVTLDGGAPNAPALVELWRAGQLTDTVVTAEGQDFACHKLVLAAGSEFFEGKYCGSGAAMVAERPQLPQTPAAAFAACLDFLYAGSCSVGEGELVAVLHAANFLGVPALERSAAGALAARLAPCNALAVWTVAERLATVPQLEEAAKETALAAFEELGESLAAEASVEQVEALVADERLEARGGEEAVFRAVARWAEAQRPEEGALLRLLRHVRFPLMARAFLEQTVYTWTQLDTKEGQMLLRDAMTPAALGTPCRPRVGFGPRALYVLGGYNGGRLDSVEIYDPKANAWSVGVPLPTVRKWAAVAVLGGKLYVLGGFAGDASSVDAFDPQTGVWAEVAPMSTGRNYPAAAALGDRLYAIGGWAGTRLSSVEAFDPQSGAWTAVASMPTARNGAGAAVLNGKIYVVGGESVDDNMLNTVEVYDPATNAWTAAAPMGMARDSFGVAVLGGKIYAAGGYDGDNYLDSVEVYDPLTNAWTAVAPMVTARYMFGLAVVQGKLYAVGGESDEDEFLNTAEAYDTQQNRWEAVAPIATARSSFASAAM